MLHTETVAPATWNLLTRFMLDAKFSDFALVGGTALALQLGHRVSVDLDLFSENSFEESELSAYLVDRYGLKLDVLAKSTVKGEIEGVQVDFLAHPYPWVSTWREQDAVRLANVQDIAAMKLNAIAGNGTRLKDFVDVAYLSSCMSFAAMLQAYERKYQANVLMPVKALVYWEDVNFQEPIKMLGTLTYSWKKVEKRLLEMQRHPDKVFPAL